MALQVCSRCRKRKIRCDLQLPSCKNCRLADVECLFWDDSLQQEIPCSYLHSLRQKVASLELEVRHAEDRSSIGSGDPGQVTRSTQIAEQGFHLANSDPAHLQSYSVTNYLGPGSSAQLLDRLLKLTVEWHLAQDIPIPKRLLPDEPFRITESHVSKTQLSYQVIGDPIKTELHSVVPVSTQRAIIDHYSKTVLPEYNFLPNDWQSSLLRLQNPLKWSSANKDDAGAFSIYIVFAISTALIARDLDPNLSSIATRCKDGLIRITRRDVSPADLFETTKWMCRALCGLAICELITPTSGQLWDLLGRAVSTMETLRESYQLRGLSLDSSFREIERSLLKLEMLNTLHLRRPLQYHPGYLSAILATTPSTDSLSAELGLLRHWVDIMFEFTISPQPSEEHFQGLVPLPLRINTMSSEISIHSATIYLALHPLFTTSDILGDRAFPNPPSTLFHSIARSAHTMIDQFARRNENNEIVSIWMAAERVLEAGLVWAAYLISQRGASPAGDGSFGTMSTSLVMGTLLKVSSLLASFAARWKGGSGFVDAWETFIELLWNLL